MTRQGHFKFYFSRLGNLLSHLIYLSSAIIFIHLMNKNVRSKGLCEFQNNIFKNAILIGKIMSANVVQRRRMAAE